MYCITIDGALQAYNSEERSMILIYSIETKYGPSLQTFLDLVLIKNCFCACSVSEE
jgi:hypothetical protein